MFQSGQDARATSGCVSDRVVTNPLRPVKSCLATVPHKPDSYIASKNRLSWLKRTRLSFRKKTKRMVSVTFSMSTFTVSVMIDRSSASSHGVTEQKVRENSTRQTLESGHFTVGLRWFGLFLYDCKKGVLQHWRKLTALENEAKVHRHKLHVINFCWYRYVQREFELFWRCLPTVTTVIRRCFHTFKIFTFVSILARSRLSR